MILQHPELLLQISPSSGVPIYRQVVEQVTRMIAGGQLAPGDFLPSVRQLAMQLEVNPMTISKAFSVLEMKGLVERLRGKGMVVKAIQEQGSVEQRLTMLQPLVVSLIEQSKQLDIDQETVVTWLTKQLSKDTS